MVRGDISLHGRGDELSRLARLLDLAERGRTQYAFIEGQAGIGKTRLAEELIELARSRGFAVAAAKADELEFGRPFGPIAAALGCEGRDGGAIQVEIASLLAGGEVPEARIVDLLVELIEAETASEPLALAIEDLQWADASTLTTLLAARRRLEFVPLLVVGSLRPLPRRPELERMIDTIAGDAGVRLELQPLDEDAVGALVSELLGAEPGPGLLRQAAATSGNPLFLTELVAALEAEERIVRHDGVAETASLDAPPSLGPILLRRLGYLSAGAIELLKLAAILGDALSANELSAVAGRPLADLLGELEEIQRAGVLVEREGALRFRHDLIREAVYTDLPENVRAALHAECGRALAAAGAPAPRVAQQFAMAPPPADREAIDAIEAGVAETEEVSPATAAELQARAIELLSPEMAVERPRMLARLSKLRTSAGDRAAGEQAAWEAIELAGGASGAAWEALVRSLLAQGKFQELVEVSGRALEHEGLDQIVRGRVLALRGLGNLWTFDHAAARRDCEEALTVGERAGDDVAVSLAYSHFGAVSSLAGEFDTGLEYGRKAVAAARSTDAQRQQPYIGLVFDQIDAAMWKDAAESVVKARAMIERNGAVVSLPLFHVANAQMAFFRAEWDDAVVEAEAALRAGEEAGESLPGVTGAHGLIATIAVHRGQLESAQENIGRAMAVIEREGMQWGVGWVQRAALAAQRSEGNLAAALAMALEGWSITASMPGAQGFIAPQLIEVALSAGEPERAREALGVLESLASKPDSGPHPANARFGRGLIEADAGALLDAAGLYEEIRFGLEVARSREEAAILLAGRSGDREAAAKLLDQAVATYEELGAARDESRAIARGREAGLGRGRRGARKRAETGWESLTPSELNVVELAAQGLTNPQIGERLFISRRTVQTHLSNVFRKLELTSRVELAAAVAQAKNPLSKA